MYLGHDSKDPGAIACRTDLDVRDEGWLSSVLERGLPVLDHGLGVAGWEYGRPLEDGEICHRRVLVASGPKDFSERHVRGLAAVPAEMLRRALGSGRASTGSQVAAELGHPEVLESYVSHVGYCKDVLYLTAVDARGAGISIVIPLAKITTLSPHEARRWYMLAAHLEAGHRLRGGIAAAETPQETVTDLPHRAEAILETRSFRIAEAKGPAQRRKTNKMIAYRLGLSTSRISLVLRKVMQKRGARTRAQLVAMTHDLPGLGQS